VVGSKDIDPNIITWVIVVNLVHVIEIISVMGGLVLVGVIITLIEAYIEEVKIKELDCLGFDVMCEQVGESRSNGA